MGDGEWNDFSRGFIDGGDEKLAEIVVDISSRKTCRERLENNQISKINPEYAMIRTALN